MDIFQKLLQIEDETGGDVSNLRNLINSGQLTTASEINRPNPKQSVKEIELFNEFNLRNPRADVGRMGFKRGTDPDTSPVYNEKTGHIFKKGNRFGTYYSKTPGTNQYGALTRSLEEVQKIIDYSDGGVITIVIIVIIPRGGLGGGSPLGKLYNLARLVDHYVTHPAWI